MRAVNLLTPELRSTSKVAGAPAVSDGKGGLGAYVLLGALALCVVAVAGYVLAGNTVKQRTSELAAVSTQTDTTVKRVSDLKRFVDFQTLAQQRAGTVQALASARFDWEQSLRDLSRALPSNVYLSSLDGTVGGAGGGGASSGVRGSITSPAIELKGCTRSQPAVADLMSRLRNVEGVTRVTLAKSDKETPLTTSGGGAGGSSVNPCGKGSPPSFDLVAFFEGATVDSALATATGATTAPAAGGAAPTAPAQANGAAATASATPTPAATTQGGTTP